MARGEGAKGMYAERKREKYLAGLMQSRAPVARKQTAKAGFAAPAATAPSSKKDVQRSVASAKVKRQRKPMKREGVTVPNRANKIISAGAALREGKRSQEITRRIGTVLGSGKGGQLSAYEQAHEYRRRRRPSRKEMLGG